MKKTAVVSPTAPALAPAPAPVLSTSPTTTDPAESSTLAGSVMDIDEEMQGVDTPEKGKNREDSMEWSATNTNENDGYTTTSSSLPSSSSTHSSEMPRNLSSLPLVPSSSSSISKVIPRARGTRMTRRKSQEESERGLLAIQQVEGTGLELEVEAALAVVSA